MTSLSSKCQKSIRIKLSFKSNFNKLSLIKHNVKENSLNDWLHSCELVESLDCQRHLQYIGPTSKRDLNQEFFPTQPPTKKKKKNKKIEPLSDRRIEAGIITSARCVFKKVPDRPALPLADNVFSNNYNHVGKYVINLRGSGPA